MERIAEYHPRWFSVRVHPRASPRRFSKPRRIRKIRRDAACASLEYHLVLYVLVPLVLLVLVAVAAHGGGVLLRVLRDVRRVRVDALGVQRRKGPRQGFRLELRYGRVPRGQVSRLLRLAAARRQFLDGPQ